jgi:N-acyl-D-aspartate/D-glutamate deacylase
VLDVVIKGGTVIDGTGTAGYSADVGFADGRIVEIGTITDKAATTYDADGLVVAPGFVDPHTHYDAQLFWDPAATPSSLHGVTTVMSGNCGFTLAPLKAQDADYIRRMMVQVEGMPLGALETGVPWDWETFPEYLDRLEGRIGVNAGFMVGHCALRLYTMGEAALTRAATEDEITAMSRILAESIEAGALGLSSTRSATHSDGDGRPVASRVATEQELLALSHITGKYDGTGLEVIVNGCIATEGFSESETELLVAMTAESRRPLNWNVYNPDPAMPNRGEHQFEPSRRARASGGKIAVLTMPLYVPQTQSFLTHCGMQLLPDWKQVFGLPVQERIARLRQPEVRDWLLERATSPDAGVLRRLGNFENYVIGDTYSEANAGLTGRSVAEIAAERRMRPFDCLVDIVINDELRTILWPVRPENDDVWQLRQEVWDDPDALLGGSDAGAHLDRMCGAGYTTSFLAEMIRGRRLVSIEKAVQMITDAPARHYGLRHRGRVTVGYHADITVFDPTRVGAGLAGFASDMPGGASRLTAPSEGIAHVFVNGERTVADGIATGATSGAVLRSGKGTHGTETA